MKDVEDRGLSLSLGSDEGHGAKRRASKSDAKSKVQGKGVFRELPSAGYGGGRGEGVLQLAYNQGVG